MSHAALAQSHRWQDERRRAVVLLIVLLSIVGLASAVVTLSRSASMVTMASTAALHGRMADDLLGACEAPILYWLDNASSHVVLAPDESPDRLTVLNDSMSLGGVPARVLIEARDECGPSRLNISTAPMSAIGAALSERGLDGLEAIRIARAEGRLPPLPHQRDVPDDRGVDGQDPGRISFVNTSPRWELRMSVRVGSVSRSWLAVYVHAGERWELQERELARE